MGTRLTDPHTGSTVSVADEDVEHYETFGYTRQSSSKPAGSKTSSSSSKSSK